MGTNLDNPVTITSEESRGRDKMVEFATADGNRLKFFQVGTVAQPKRLILQDFLLTGVNREDGTFVEVKLEMEDMPGVWKTLCRMRLEGKEMKTISTNFTGSVSTYRAKNDAVMRFQLESADSTDYVFNITVVGREQRNI